MPADPSYPARPSSSNSTSSNASSRSNAAAEELVHKWRRASERANRRHGVNRFLTATTRHLAWPLLGALAAMTAYKLVEPSQGTMQLLVGLLVAGTLTVLGFGLYQARRGRRPHEGALRLDRHHGLDERLTTALAFADLPPSERTPWMNLAIDDAAAHVDRLEVRRAVPLRWPRGLSGVLVLGAGLLVLSRFRLHEPPEPPAPVSVAAEETSVLLPDDADLLREMGAELLEDATTPESQQAARRFNQVIEDLAERRLDKRDALAELAALERELEGTGLPGEELEEALQDRAAELEKAGLSKPAGEALDQGRLKDAEEAMRALAERLRNQDDPPSKAELDALRKSLEKAAEVAQSKQQKNQAKSLEKQISDLEERQKRLLQKQQEGKATEADQREQRENKRQLERLRRNQKQQQQMQRELSELDKQIAEAARQLQKEMGKSRGQSGDFLDRSADAVKKLEQHKRSEAEKKELLRKLKEMRELLRQQKQNGGQEQQNWTERMRKFSQRARGGKQGQGEQREGQGQPRPGQSGQSRPGGIRFGPDGQPIPMAGETGAQPGQGRGPGEQSGEPGQGGREPGKGHDPNLTGEASKSQFDTHDVMAAGQDTGQGTASSETIYGASERGFSTAEYEKIYRDYETVAEDVIEREDIPPGYRFYVRRYFDLIRPRETRATGATNEP